MLFSKKPKIHQVNYTVGMFYEVYIGSKYYHGLKPLTYAHGTILDVGQIVRIPLRGKSSLGVIKAKVQQPEFKCSPINEVLPLHIPVSHLQLIEWLLSYYPAPMGSIIDLFLPKLTKRTDVDKAETQATALKVKNLPTLTPEQEAAMKQFIATKMPVILHGRTGSGKTRLYQEIVIHALQTNKSVVVLAPEIGLSRHLSDRFSEIIPSERIVILHSSMSDKKRREAWLKINQTTEPLVIIGARSALFAPLHAIGAIILDEFHDSAYKQEQLPNYQTTRVAAQLATYTGARLVLGSATPPVADYIAFETKKLPILSLKSSAITPTEDSGVEHRIVDLGEPQEFTQSPHVSNALIDSIRESLGQNEQSMVFLNRRGSARVIACESCGWRSTCPNCDVGHTYHGDKQKLICHSCGLQQPLPNSCPDCGSSDLVYTIAGTKTLEAELTKLFPHANIHRLDRDTTAENKIERILNKIESGEIDIIIGTQTIVKGFDLKKLSTVGIIYADASLQIADYTATERTYQLISQVAGRLGRGHRNGRLILQTHNPTSDVLRWALQNDYPSLLEAERLHRQKYNFPPYQYIMKINAKRASQLSAKKALDDLLHRLPVHSSINIGNPSPSYPEKLAGKYRWQIVVKSENRAYLVQIAKQLPKNYSYDLDPNTLL